jgi:hypothetical protein
LELVDKNDIINELRTQGHPEDFHSDFPFSLEIPILGKKKVTMRSADDGEVGLTKNLTAVLGTALAPLPTAVPPTSVLSTSVLPVSPTISVYSTSVLSGSPTIEPERIVLSDVTSLREHQIQMQVASEIRQRFNATSRWKILERARYFISRERRVRRETARRLENERNNSRPFTMSDDADNELTAAADRHARDATLATETITLDPIFQADVDRLANEYIDANREPPMEDRDFKQQFNDIISQDPAFGGRNMDERFFSTNILNVLQAKRAESALDREVNDVLEAQFIDPNDPNINTNYTQLYHRVSEYVRNFGRDPVFRAELDTLLLGVSDGQMLDRGRLANYLNHINSCARLRINNARLQIDMITTGR